MSKQTDAEPRRSTYRPKRVNPVEALVSQGSRDMAHNLDRFRNDWMGEVRKEKLLDPRVSINSTNLILIEDPTFDAALMTRDFTTFESVDEARAVSAELIKQRGMIQTWLTEHKVYVSRKIGGKEAYKLRLRRATLVAKMHLIEIAQRVTNDWVRNELGDSRAKEKKQHSRHRKFLKTQELLEEIKEKGSPALILLAFAFTLILKFHDQLGTPWDKEDRKMVRVIGLFLDEIVKSGDLQGIDNGQFDIGEQVEQEGEGNSTDTED